MDTEEEVSSGKANHCACVLDSHGVDGSVSHHSGGCSTHKLTAGSVKAEVEYILSPRHMCSSSRYRNTSIKKQQEGDYAVCSITYVSHM